VFLNYQDKEETPQKPEPWNPKIRSNWWENCAFLLGGVRNFAYIPSPPFLPEFGLPPRGARGPLPKSRKRRYWQISKIRFTYKNQNISKIDFLLFKLSRL